MYKQTTVTDVHGVHNEITGGINTVEHRSIVFQGDGENKR
jgi:hypothetical protein